MYAIRSYYAEYIPGTTEEKVLYVRYVRNNSAYGVNSFQDNGDGTITDLRNNFV